ncbi:MAG: transporter substrate-binding domain-containing protein [Bacillota bacterium]|nr:transporter substrate-binding domain-containing protein [Bacillota bacterium]
MKKNFKLAIVSMLILAMIIPFSGCGRKGSGEFRVGMECGYPPFNWTQTNNSNGAVRISDGSGYASGYDVEIAKKLAESLGKKLVIVKTQWDGLIPALQAGSIDAVIAGMSPTAERKLTIDFSNNYYRSDLVLVVKKGSKYESATSLKDFAGAKVTAQLNTFHYTVIDQIPNVVKASAMDDFTAMRVALQSGIIDAYVSERPEGISASAANPDFKMVALEKGKGFKTSDDDVAIAVGLKKGQTETLKKINEVLAKISDKEKTQIMDNAIKNQPAAQK